MSNKQLKANKENAKKSTGPRSGEGKAIVAKNALKHGILSAEVVIDGIEEDREEFEALGKRLVGDLKPVGVMEQMLVDKMAVTYWRMRRVLWAEEGEIRKQTDDLWFKEMIKIGEQADRFDRFPFGVDFTGERLLNYMSAERAKNKLKSLKKSLGENGYWHKEEIEQYVELKNLSGDKEIFSLVYFLNEVASGKVKEEASDKGVKGLMYFLDKDIEQVELAVGLAKEMTEREVDSKSMRGCIPSSGTVDRLHRYETMLDNQLYRAMNQLIKLQALRKGGSVLSAKALEVEGIRS